MAGLHEPTGDGGPNPRYEAALSLFACHGRGPTRYAGFLKKPDGFGRAPVTPDAAFYSADYRQFLLLYEAVRTAEDPDATALGFLQSTYQAAADLGRWDRNALEYRPVEGTRPGR